MFDGRGGYAREKLWNENLSRDTRASEEIEFRNLSSTRVRRVYRGNF